MAGLPKNFAALLRAEGLTVVEIPGWYGRKRPGRFGPVGVLWHHTGATADGKAYAEWLAKTGRSDLPAPLCQISIGRNGTVYLCASGRSNHAGKAKSVGSVASGDGNSLYYGIEFQNNGSEGFKAPQYNAGVKVTKVILQKVTKTSVRTVAGHKETSVTGKWDPGTVDMGKVRADVQKALTPPKPAPKPTSSRWRTAVDKILGRTSLTLQTVTANVGTKATADTFKRAATGCQLGGLQEVDTAADVRNAQTALKNHGYNGRGGDGQHNVGIVYDKKLFRHVNSGYRKHFDGESGISHTRHMLWVELELIEDPSKHIILVASHYPPAAFWPGGQQRTSGDRIPKRVAMWEQAQAAEIKLLNELAAKGYPMVTFSDANRQKISRLPATIAGRKTHAISNALDWIIYIDGAKVTWTPHEVVKVDIGSKGHPALQNRATLRYRR